MRSKFRYREYQRRMSIRRLARLREDVMLEVRAHMVDEADPNSRSFPGARPQEIELLSRDGGSGYMKYYRCHYGGQVIL